MKSMIDTVMEFCRARMPALLSARVEPEVRQMLVFLTGSGGQGKTQTARLLGKQYGWHVILNEDHYVQRSLDPERRRFSDDELYLRVKRSAWERFEKRIDNCLNGPSRIALFDSCPFLYGAATLRRLCSCEGRLGPALGEFEARVCRLLAKMETTANKVLKSRPWFFFFPFERCQKIEDDGYRSPSALSHMALAKIVLADLGTHGCRYRTVLPMGKAETAAWIAQQVQGSPRYHDSERCLQPHVIGTNRPSPILPGVGRIRAACHRLGDAWQRKDGSHDTP